VPIGKIETCVRPGPAIVAVHHGGNDEADLVGLGGESRERERFHSGRRQSAVDKTDIVDAQVLPGRLAAELSG
jgi:hypothetical protein